LRKLIKQYSFSETSEINVFVLFDYFANQTSHMKCFKYRCDVLTYHVKFFKVKF